MLYFLPKSNFSSLIFLLVFVYLFLARKYSTVSAQGVGAKWAKAGQTKTAAIFELILVTQNNSRGLLPYIKIWQKALSTKQTGN